MFGFILIGYVEEGFKFEFAGFNFGWFMTFIELIIFSCFALIEKYLKNSNQPLFDHKIELKYHIFVAAAMTVSRGLTNVSLFLLNYPTQVIFKSMKLISVMIGSRYFLHKKYSFYDYCAAPVMVSSAIAFSVGLSYFYILFLIFLFF